MTPADPVSCDKRLTTRASLIAMRDRRMPISDGLENALARLAVLETLIAQLAIADTTLRDGMLLACEDICENIRDAREEVAALESKTLSEAAE